MVSSITNKCLTALILNISQQKCGSWGIKPSILSVTHKWVFCTTSGHFQPQGCILGLPDWKTGSIRIFYGGWKGGDETAWILSSYKTQHITLVILVLLQIHTHMYMCMCVYNMCFPIRLIESLCFVTLYPLYPCTLWASNRYCWVNECIGICDIDQTPLKSNLSILIFKKLNM